MSKMLGHRVSFRRATQDWEPFIIKSESVFAAYEQATSAEVSQTTPIASLTWPDNVPGFYCKQATAIKTSVLAGFL